MMKIFNKRRSQSMGEFICEKLLKQMGLKYKQQVKVNGVKDINHLPFDFKLVEKINGWIIFIEVDGEQHFMIVNKFGGVEGFQKRQEHDKIKDKYIENSRNCLLIRVRYMNGNIKQKTQSCNFVYDIINKCRYNQLPPGQRIFRNFDTKK